MESLETIEYKGHKIKVYQDEDAENPRSEWDNFGHMVCWHGRYVLGDEQPRCSPNEFLLDLAIENDPGLERKLEYWENGNGWAQLSKGFPDFDGQATKASAERVDALVRDSLGRHIVSLPLYLYDHGDITMSTGSFNDPWDSGQVGFIYVTKEEIKKEYGVKRVTKGVRDKVLALLESEVKTYAIYLEGRVYGYQTFYQLEPASEADEAEEGEVIDSCWGFYGDPEGYMIPEAKSIIDHRLEESHAV